MITQNCNHECQLKANRKCGHTANEKIKVGEPSGRLAIVSRTHLHILGIKMNNFKTYDKQSVIITDCKGDVTTFWRDFKRANSRSGSFAYARVQILCTKKPPKKTVNKAYFVVFVFSVHRISTCAYANLPERKLARLMPRQTTVISPLR
jgi:hypothetical protein